MRPAQVLVGESRRRSLREGGVEEAEEEEVDKEEERSSSSSRRASCLPGESSAVAACLKRTRWRVPIEVIVGCFFRFLVRRRRRREKNREAGEEVEDERKRKEEGRTKTKSPPPLLCYRHAGRRGALVALSVCFSHESQENINAYSTRGRDGEPVLGSLPREGSSNWQRQWRHVCSIFFSLSLSPAKPRSSSLPEPGAGSKRPLVA